MTSADSRSSASDGSASALQNRSQRAIAEGASCHCDRAKCSHAGRERPLVRSITAPLASGTRPNDASRPAGTSLRRANQIGDRLLTPHPEIAHEVDHLCVVERLELATDAAPGGASRAITITRTDADVDGRHR